MDRVSYPNLESQIAPLENDEKCAKTVQIEKELVEYLSKLSNEQLLDIPDAAILPVELLPTISSKKITKSKPNPLKRLQDLPTEEEEQDDEQVEEEEEDEEERSAEDEEDDAGGDYLVSHFDNGEGFEDNDDDGDEANPMI